MSFKEQDAVKVLAYELTFSPASSPSIQHKEPYPFSELLLNYLAPGVRSAAVPEAFDQQYIQSTRLHPITLRHISLASWARTLRLSNSLRPPQGRTPQVRPPLIRQIEIPVLAAHTTAPSLGCFIAFANSNRV